MSFDAALQSVFLCDVSERMHVAGAGSGARGLRSPPDLWDERTHAVQVEYDASRLREDDVGALLTEAGLALQGEAAS
jgi:hypothetical protein